MKEWIAYCGLNCELCDARIATLHNDDALREKTALLWSRLNGAQIMPDMICCTGCRTDGPKTVYCSTLCPVRKCAREKGVETCGECGELGTCPLIGQIHANNPQAAKNIKTVAEGRLSEK